MKATLYTRYFYGDAFSCDPLPHYVHMRATGPVAWLKKNRCYVVALYDQVVEVLRGADRFQTGSGLSLNGGVSKLPDGSTLYSDGDVQSKRHSETSLPIMPRHIQPLEDCIYSVAQSLDEALVAKARDEVVTDFAPVLPLSIAADLIGLNDQGQDQMLKFASATFNLFEGFNARSQTAFDDLGALHVFLAEHGRRDASKDSGLAQRIFDLAPDKEFSEKEAAQLMRDYINPSLDMTVSAASFAAHYFAKFPDQWNLLRERPDLLPNAAEKRVRMATTIRAFSRFVAEDAKITGIALEQNCCVIAVHASASGHANMRNEPDKFDITRSVRKHLGLGHGKYICMGLHLARRGLINLVDVMRLRVKRWVWDGESEIAMINTIRALAHLPTRVGLI